MLICSKDCNEEAIPKYELPAVSNKYTQGQEKYQLLFKALLKKPR